MADTRKIFDKVISEIAEVVKLINEEGEDVDSKVISDKNDDISDLHAILLDEKNDFVALTDLKDYIKKIVGKNYFTDKRCWDYLYDSVYEVFMDMPNEFDEDMQTGLGMAQILPTNSVYDGELDDLYNSDEEEKKDMNKRQIEKRGNEEDEKLALAEFKSVDVSEIEDGYRDHMYEVDGEEYWVSDYDTAYDEAVRQCKELFDDMGLELVNEDIQEYFLEKYVDESFFEQVADEESDYYISEMSDEELLEYAHDHKIAKNIDDVEDENFDRSDIADACKSEYRDEILERGMADYFEDIYGRNWIKEMKDTLKDYLDYDGMAEYCVDTDGIAHSMATYDGDENIEKVNGVEYYIYRMN